MSGLPTDWEQRAQEPQQAGFVLGLDVGSSVIRCHVYDRAARVCGSSAQKVESLYPQTGWVEIDPDVLWIQFVTVIKEAVKAAGIQMSQIVGLGISTQRATFITWNKKTGNHFHNFISWQDLRAVELVKSWNNSLIMKVIFFFCDLDIIVFFLLFLIDEYILYNIIGLIYVNMYILMICFYAQMCWSGIITSLISIPLSLLPPVRDTSHNFGSVDEEIFGVPIPIVALVADQQSAMFGECCFQTGDVKLTMGTGTFLDINTGNSPQQTIGGFYPLIGWKIGQEVVCLAESNAGDTGTAIKWAQQLDLFTDAAETEKMAKSLEDSEGVCFVPSFSGLQVFFFKSMAITDIFLPHPNLYIYHSVTLKFEAEKLCSDGNSFIMQMTSDLINENIDRPADIDMSCLGAASLAGLAVGFWTDKEELKKLRQSEVVFKPQKKCQEYETSMENWAKAVKRSMNWYNKT
uniref:Glycerol kinase 5 n=1 Tax=Aotus nancymaae TaxID=37293 RepID=A0A2K5DJ14_AOTNA